MGEFGPLIVISFALIPTHDTVWHTLFMLAFVGVAVLVADMAIRVRSSGWMDAIANTMRSSDHLPVRICIAVQALLVALAAKFGINVVIGAFTAGLVVNFSTKEESGLAFRKDLGAIGYGFLIPFFFINAGMRFDISALWARPLGLIEIAALLGFFVLIRAVPLLLYKNELAPTERLPFALYSATGLPLIVIISEIGLSSGSISLDQAAILVSAGMVSVLLFPTIAQRLMERAKQEAEMVISED